MRTSNPVLSRDDAFSPYLQQGGTRQGAPQQQGGRMTIDDVIAKTAVTMAVVMLVAAATFFMMPDQLIFPAAIGASLATIVITFIVAARRHVPVGLVMVFAALEGVMVGGISKIFETIYPGIVVQAVFGTFVAAAVTLATYKFFNIKVSGRFAKIVGIATIAMAVALLANFGLSFLGINLGLRSGVTGPVGLLPILISAIAVVLAVLNLILDFDYIERGVAMGAPANQSWKAAFGLTATLVWLYVELLRIISYFRR
ncbi:Bax inhibitor-1/YccA family protein [Enemella evansiae]|uniref:Bax inhibitor-1/YccA family protein n=1 Tax=Enemella evansiae TaxID=2016499 RepID=A0A255GCD9_9ACTN|nr:Bax inhibitor-1/YccA family protein [Enemella evansiae]PFG68262.1 putative YccA/Bax inhibitor family protein [Propionibacteriaceae bacterium ES.041]OYO00991.1 hypothetical protein CGZ96_03865 [Enemella evansiae]OYO03100.1 hypothetical protein CGZ95_04760 [Enemella evansiae]OYO03784.1 hypothetical protein CGZ97_10280 [Enemella evansiae]OYO08072.1 hypothetical protein CGZ98_16075 [Enemella evansiae]